MRTIEERITRLQNVVNRLQPEVDMYVRNHAEAVETNNISDMEYYDETNPDRIIVTADLIEAKKQIEDLKSQLV